jgi:hypothetical protein
MTIGAGVSTYPWAIASIVQNAPRQSGVYAILGEQDCVYVGASGDIQASLLAHIKGDNSCITRNSPIGFQFSLVPSSLRVFQLNQLIIALWPICNLHEE